MELPRRAHQTVATCTSTSVVAGGGGQFNTIALHVRYTGELAEKRVEHLDSAWGGGDVTHTNSGNGVPGDQHSDGGPGSGVDHS